MSNTRTIEVKCETITNGVLLRPIGDIDLFRSPSLRESITTTQASNPRRIVIDLSKVPYMDSSGLATLIEAMQNARHQNTELILCGLQERVQSIFEIARLETVFTIVEECDDALNES